MIIFLRGTATCCAVAALFLAACSDGGSPQPSAQVMASSAASATPTPTPKASPTSTGTATPTDGSNTPTPAPTPTATCVPLSEPLAMRMIYPEYNATGVPDNASVIVYAPTYNLSSPIPLALGIGNASPVALQPTAVPSPGPTPSEAPTAGAIEYAAALPALRPATNYTIYAILTYNTYANCAGTSTGPWVISSFTTQ
jgi:hypothetical protein